MKVFFCFVAFLALAQAFEIDYTQVRHRDIDIINRRYVPHHQGRIVGGEEVEKNSIPHQVAMFVTVGGLQYFCGGSLISPKYVLTAAHCVDGASSANIILGAHQVQAAEDTQIRVTSTEFAIHKGWSASTLRNDIAIVKLPEAVTLNDNIKLIDLPTYSMVGVSLAGVNSTVSGWGKDSDQATGISPVLRSVHVPVITNLICNLSFLGVIQESNICTGGEGDIGSCSGDSGGPLVYNNKQIGVVSFGIALGCEVGWPSAFTRTTSYLDWIAANSDVEIQAN